MRRVLEHIEHIKGKPHHVRKRVALVSAAAGTAVIALVWLFASLGTGAFALGNTSFAESTGRESATLSGGANPLVAGAGAARESASLPAHIEIVDVASSTQAGKKAEQTTIPF